MNRITILKVAAIVFAVVLVGGFVSYRAGAFDKYFSPPPTPEPLQPAPEPTEEPTPTAISPSDMDAILMSTSKSAGVLIPPPKKSPPTETTKPPAQIMPGSKSLAPLIPPKAK